MIFLSTSLLVNAFLGLQLFYSTYPDLLKRVPGCRWRMGKPPVGGMKKWLLSRDICRTLLPYLKKLSQQYDNMSALMDMGASA